jgi:radical SAM protein (TIGR01212 family)
MFRYNSFNRYLQDKWGCRIHKIPLDAGFSCPNRHSQSRTGAGCIYCETSAFSPYSRNSTPPPLREQIRAGILHGSRRYHAKGFIAYFQPFTNTFAPLHVLRERYDVIREFPEICGLAIGTRPDCVDDEILDLIESYSKDYEVWIEYGLQSSSNQTLLSIRRGHTVEQFLEAVQKTAQRTILICVHVILGLPGEGRKEILETARLLAGIPIHGVKIHHCHVIRDTPLAEWYLQGTYQPPAKEQYIDWVCDFLDLLPERILIHRLLGDAPRRLLLAPMWAQNKTNVLEEIQAELARRGSLKGIRAGIKS